MATQMVTQHNVKVVMRDGVQIALDIYLPVGAAAHPALLALSAYGKRNMKPGIPLSSSVHPTIEHGHTERLIELGYVHVVGDVRGTGDSGGRYCMWGTKEQEDCFDLIEWIAAQPWCDGNVGMIGISYFAMLHVPAAALKPPHLKAIMPFEPAGADLYRDWFYQGGLLNRQFLLIWPHFVVANEPKPLSFDEYSASELKQRIDHVRHLPEFDGDQELQAVLDNPGSNPIMFDALLHHEDGEFYWERSSVNKFQHVSIPTCFGSWGNVNQIDALGAFRGFRQIRSQQRKLLVGPPVFPDRPSWQYAEQVERWYGRWLKGEPTGVENDAPLRLFVTGESRWREASEWPLPETKWTAFHLHSDGWLHEYPPTSDEGSTTFDFIVGTHGSAFFESSVLLEDTAIVGPTVFHLSASCTTTDTSWIVTIYDIFPDGTRYFLTRGWLKASHRAIEPALSTPWSPHHPHRAAEPIKPKQIYDYEIELMPMMNMFRSGHRIGVEVSCDDFALAENGRGWLASVMPTQRLLIDQLMLERFFTPHAVDRRPKTLAIMHNADHPSYLVVPVVSGNVLGTSSYMRANDHDIPPWMG